MQIVIKPDLKGLVKGMKDFQKRQLPFAMAQALTATAGRAGQSWQQDITQTFDRPTPFTVGAVAVSGARKTRLIATVYIKPIAAQYLEPYVDGGDHFLGGKRGLLTPKNVPLNAYGNLTKGKLAALKARPDVFIGPVTLRNGQTINGVWQRNKVSAGSRRGKLGKRTGGYGTKGSHNLKANKALGVTSATTLKLLIRFTDAQPVRQHLDFNARAEAAVRQHFNAEFTKSLAKAMATAN